MKLKYFHTTVPHSGTRYINGVVEQAIGQKVVQTPTLKHWEKAENPTFVFCHVGRKWIDTVHWGIENSEKHWMTIRSPIHTWGTHWYNMEATLWRNKYGWQEKLGQMREQYTAQQQLVEDYPDLHIHVVENEVSYLGEYLELDLQPEAKTFSRPSRMKRAIQEHDIETMQKLCNDTDFFEAFRDNITPDIKDFYEGHGYDIWWT